MKQNSLIYGFIGIFLISIVGYLTIQYKNARIPPSFVPSQVNKTNCLADDCLSVDNLEYPASSVSDGAARALALAIDDEYHALSFYVTVISR